MCAGFKNQIEKERERERKKHIQPILLRTREKVKERSSNNRLGLF